MRIFIVLLVAAGLFSSFVESRDAVTAKVRERQLFTEYQTAFPNSTDITEKTEVIFPHASRNTL